MQQKLKYEEIIAVHFDTGCSRWRMRGHLPRQGGSQRSIEGPRKHGIDRKLAEGESETDAGFVAFGSMLGTGLAGIVLDNTLKVENHFVCSVGTITYAGKTKIVSIGILNHVFTADKEDFKQALESL